MRTSKEVVVTLDQGDDLVVRYRGSEIKLMTSLLDIESDFLEIMIPSGHAISGLTSTSRDGSGSVVNGTSLSFANEDDLLEEVHGELRLITFRLPSNLT